MGAVEQVVEIRNVWDCVRCIPENKQDILNMPHCKTWDITDLIFKDGNCYFIAEDWPEGLHIISEGDYALFRTNTNWKQPDIEQITPEMYRLFYYPATDGIVLNITPAFAEYTTENAGIIYDPTRED